ncbi:MAG: adenylate/guanylate cyclase domain-containing protein [Acidimicrobiales bacterium]
MDVEQLVAAGLYDPDAPDADDRLTLLRYLADSGATVEEMVEANRNGNLTSLITDQRLRRGQLSAEDLAERADVAVSDVVEVYRLLGVAVPDVHDQIFEEREIELIELLRHSGVEIPHGVTEEILRAIGAALEVVAESAVAAFVGSFEDELDRQGSQLHRAQVTTASGELGLKLGEMMAPLLRHHLWAAISRQRAAMVSSHDRLETTLSVGFVDLVGFTAASATMQPGELLEFMRNFHSLAFDVVTTRGGRVVKHIGDEIMFTIGEPVAACDIALSLIEAFDIGDARPRGGVAHGSVIARHGDYYGTVVNLAARLVDTAVPGEVLADAGIADVVASAEAALVAEPAGRRLLKGFADPVRVVSVSRRPG